MLAPEDWKTAIEDARMRNGALVNLIHSTDNQALALLRLFVTLGIATAAGSVSAISGVILFNFPVAIALAIATIVLSFAAWQCFRVINPSSILLPGRGAEFWQWAANAKRPREEVFLSYLESLKEQQEKNGRLNQTQTVSLAKAKHAAILCPLVSGMGGLVAWGLPYVL